MKAPFRSALAAIVAGVVLIGPAVVAPGASAAPKPTPTPPAPDPSSPLCAMLNGSVGQLLFEAFTELQGLDPSMKLADMLPTLDSALKKMSDGLNEAKAKSQAPPYLAQQIADQADYWTKAYNAVHNNKKLAMAKLLTGKGAQAKQDAAQKLLDDSQAFCDPNAPTPTAPATSLSLDSTTWAPGKTAATKVVKVTANSSWKATADPSCGPIKVIKGNGQGSGQFKVKAPKNKSSARSCVVTVTAGSDQQQLTITQAGA